ncbi:hypothetical protein T03_14755 [Trichinella britovi]|uniref:Uncharacterized protein n=1 Tax=Trichinella britovi TaxID=45882 RepID=A0A0V1AHA7_TRIBR|nr:hypothetical protein T03_14755 [Trichinella britovi]
MRICRDIAINVECNKLRLITPSKVRDLNNICT